MRKFFKNYWPALALIAIIIICIQISSCATYEGAKRQFGEKVKQAEDKVKKYDVELCRRMGVRPDRCKNVDY